VIEAAGVQKLQRVYSISIVFTRNYPVTKCICTFSQTNIEAYLLCICMYTLNVERNSYLKDELINC